MAINKSNELKSGKKVAASEQHQEVSPCGGPDCEVTVIKGKPPMQKTKPSSTYNFINLNKNNLGQGINVLVIGPQTKGKF